MHFLEKHFIKKKKKSDACTHESVKLGTRENGQWAASVPGLWCDPVVTGGTGLGGPWAVGTPDFSAVLLTMARESTVIPKSLIRKIS